MEDEEKKEHTHTHTSTYCHVSRKANRTQTQTKPGGANTKVQFWELMNWRINFDETFIARQRNG